MNDSDQSTAAASRPHRPASDQISEKSGDPDNTGETDHSDRPGLWNRIKSLLTGNRLTLRDDLQVALLDSAQDATFSAGERSMLANVLKLAEMRVEQVMVPRADIVAADANETLGEVVLKLRESGHSRLPVFSRTLDDIVGMIHIKDALLHLSAPVEKPNGSPIKMLNPALRK
ncbi:MAG TPA: CBS domain-containing protein, partial [Devosia sp.]|nr:CBS domain-containing protein [Devosia sp.]